MFRSQIRESEIESLLEKVRKQSYGQYLAKVSLKKVRGFVGEPITFDFPVTAVIGPNGGGKTTVLGAACCAYKSVQPRRFFAKSGKFDATMQDWAFEYDLIDRKKEPRDTIKRTTRFANRRWNREALERTVMVFGVSRTVPAIERTELVGYANNKFDVAPSNIFELDESVATAVSKILDKNVSAFKRMEVGTHGKVILFTGATRDGAGYSEFHFGAGESSVIRMVNELESIRDEQPLIVIEEIENGLHPVATIRMVEYLIDLAQRKGVQVIFSTHSNDALKPLPHQAIWTATEDRLFQGKLDIRSLRAITGQVDKQIAIFVEDRFAKQWLEAILRQSGRFSVDHVGIYPMQGDGTAVATNAYHNKNPAVHVKSVCVIDGDSRQKESDSDAVFRLPGAAPEAHVFEQVMDAWGTIGARVAVGLQRQPQDEAVVLEACRAVYRLCHDKHLLFAQLGEKLGMLPESAVSLVFVNQWAQAYPEAVNEFLDKIAPMLPEITTAAS